MKRYKYYFILAFLLYGVLDPITTYIALQLGAHEVNPLMSGDIGRIFVAKLIVFAIVFLVIENLVNRRYYIEAGMIVGVYIAFGVVALLLNTGVYQ